MTIMLRKCEICRAWIEPERLDAAKRTNLCVKHAQEIGKYGGEFITVSQEDRSQKPGSLKINIAGVTTQMVPNPIAIEKLRKDFEERMDSTKNDAS